MKWVPAETGRPARAGKLPRLVKAGLVLVVLAVSGCAPESAGAAAAAQEFRRAAAAGDTSAACSMLSPKAREKAAASGTCEDQLASLQLPTTGPDLRTARYGRNAVVEFEDDTVFLTDHLNSANHGSSCDLASRLGGPSQPTAAPGHTGQWAGLRSFPEVTDVGSVVLRHRAHATD